MFISQAAWSLWSLTLRLYYSDPNYHICSTACLECIHPKYCTITHLNVLYTVIILFHTWVTAHICINAHLSNFLLSFYSPVLLVLYNIPHSWLNEKQSNNKKNIFKIKKKKHTQTNLTHWDNSPTFEPDTPPDWCMDVCDITLFSQSSPQTSEKSTEQKNKNLKYEITNNYPHFYKNMFMLDP